MQTTAATSGTPSMKAQHTPRLSRLDHASTHLNSIANVNTSRLIILLSVKYYTTPTVITIILQKRVGNLNGTDVNRNAVGVSFHMVCASISSELEELSTVF